MLYFVFGFDVFLFIWVVYDRGRHYVMCFLIHIWYIWLLIYIYKAIHDICLLFYVL